MLLTATSIRSTDGSLLLPGCCELTAIAWPAPTQPITPTLLAAADVFVIANAVKGGDSAEWVLPTPPAFEHDEVAALAAVGA